MSRLLLRIIPLFAELSEQELGMIASVATRRRVARGTLVVDDDLIAALDSGHLGGAVLDVFRTEPLPLEHPFWRHPKITVTPHVAGITDPRMALAYVDNCVRKFEAGAPLADIVDISRGY